MAKSPSQPVVSLPAAIAPRVETIAPNAALGVESAHIIARAARGDLTAQRIIIDSCNRLIEDGSTYAGILATEAVSMARIAASHGHRDDTRRLAGVLCQAGLIFRNAGAAVLANDYTAEALSVLEGLAATGDDLAADNASKLVEMHTPEIVELAKRFRRKADTVCEGMV